MIAATAAATKRGLAVTLGLGAAVAVLLCGASFVATRFIDAPTLGRELPQLLPVSAFLTAPAGGGGRPGPARHAWDPQPVPAALLVALGRELTAPTARPEPPVPIRRRRPPSQPVIERAPPPPPLERIDEDLWQP